MKKNIRNKCQFSTTYLGTCLPFKKTLKHCKNDYKKIRQAHEHFDDGEEKVVARTSLIFLLSIKESQIAISIGLIKLI